MGAALMNKTTIVTYKSAGGSIRFAVGSDFWITKISGIQTDISMTTSQNVGQRGTTVNGQSVQPKNVTLNGVLLGRRAPLEQQRRQLLAAVLPLETATITFEQDGERWYLEGWPTKTPVFSDGLRPQEFQFVFYVPYPYFRSTDTRRYQLSGLRALWRTPFYTGGRFYISKYTEDAFRRVENAGNVEQAITLTLYAAAEVTDPVVYSVEHGSHIRIDKVMSTGEQMIISTHDKDKDAGRAVRFIAADGIETNGFRYITTDSDLSMTVPPGGGIFMADAAANKPNLRCTLVTAGGERHSI